MRKWTHCKLPGFEAMQASFSALEYASKKKVKNRFGLRKVRYRGLAKNKAQFFSLLALANLLIAKRRLFALQGQAAT